MKAFFGTSLGKILIGIVAVAVVAGGGYGIYRAVTADVAPVAGTTEAPTEEATTTEAPATTEAETTTNAETEPETTTQAPTVAPTTAATTTQKPTTTTKKQTSTIDLSNYWDKQPGQIAQVLGCTEKEEEVWNRGPIEMKNYTYKNPATGTTVLQDYNRCITVTWTSPNITLAGMTIGDDYQSLNVKAAFSKTDYPLADVPVSEDGGAYRYIFGEGGSYLLITVTNGKVSGFQVFHYPASNDNP